MWPESQTDNTSPFRETPWARPDNTSANTRSRGWSYDVGRRAARGTDDRAWHVFAASSPDWCKHLILVFQVVNNRCRLTLAGVPMLRLPAKGVAMALGGAEAS